MRIWAPVQLVRMHLPNYLLPRTSVVLCSEAAPRNAGEEAACHQLHRVLLPLRVPKSQFTRTAQTSLLGRACF